VFEVGMGGTWDATNLVAGDVAVLCPIGLDHSELGSTVAEVAAEKAGIVKAGKVAVVREQPDEALEVIEARCAEVGARLLLEGREWELHTRAPAVGGQTLEVRGLHARYEDLILPLFGEFAGHNAAAAIVATEALLERGLDERALSEALAGATAPGRLEVIARHPLIVLDGAHNPAAAEALVAAVVEVFSWDRLHLVFAAFADKDLDGVLEPLAPLADVGYAAATDSVRARPVVEIQRTLTSRGVATQGFSSVAEALAAARASAQSGDLILVTGSLYTVADARRALVKEPRA
jgi:dihydrofolate synthase/folylpolyglutamate synthase